MWLGDIAMAKIISFNTFCYRRELKALEKELARKEEQQRKNINDLIGYAKRVADDKLDNE